MVATINLANNSQKLLTQPWPCAVCHALLKSFLLFFFKCWQLWRYLQIWKLNRMTFMLYICELAVCTRAFSVVGPSVWNGLPLALWLLPRVHSDTFYSSLKTALFSHARVGLFWVVTLKWRYINPRNEWMGRFFWLCECLFGKAMWNCYWLIFASLFDELGLVCLTKWLQAMRVSVQFYQRPFRPTTVLLALVPVTTPSLDHLQQTSWRFCLPLSRTSLRSGTAAPQMNFLQFFHGYVALA